MRYCEHDKIFEQELSVATPLYEIIITRAVTTFTPNARSSLENCIVTHVSSLARIEGDNKIMITFTTACCTSKEITIFSPMFFFVYVPRYYAKRCLYNCRKIMTKPRKIINRITR